jgi:hypothetical protein
VKPGDPSQRRILSTDVYLTDVYLVSNAVPVPLLALLQTNSWSAQLNQALFDNTFAGIHRLTWFDYSLLIPYFFCLAVLSI